jgi:hypothetical protein
MTDETERPEDTVRRFALRIQELEEWQRKYQEVAQLWEALEPAEGQQIVSAVLVGKLVNFSAEGEDAFPRVSISATDDNDWMTQMGILDAAHDFIHTEPWREDG